LAETMTRAYGSRILINLAARRLAYFEGDRQLNTYPVGVGKHSTPTPTGNYAVIEKIVNPGGALGSRWMGLSISGGNYGIHGTNNPSSIGGYVSNGCIRMHNHHVEELFPSVEIGAPVEIISGAGGSRPGTVPAGAKNGAGGHTVQPGESLWEIATKYGKDLDTLIQVNNLTDPEMIYPGQIIMIPA